MKQNRIQALDITRGIAILGMIFMNFKIAVNFQVKENLNYSFLTAQEGRFGALFIFLAGMGIALMNRKAQNNEELLKKNRIILFKRSMFLFVLGLLFSLYWQADIFHFYAFYILISLPLIKLKSKTLWILSIIPPVIFVFLNLIFDWGTGWDWVNFQYLNLYSPLGFFRNLFFNGYHPIFPWISFLFIGMAVGKSNLYIRSKQWKAVITSLIIIVVVELFSLFVMSNVAAIELNYFFSTRAMPPFPLFVISAGAQNILTLNIVLLFVGYFRKENFISKGLRESGKMVMSHYILHLFIGLIPIFLISTYLKLSTLFILLYSLIYFVFSVLFSVLWRKKFKNGPFETLMRKLSS